MYKIQTLNKIASVGLDQLSRDKYEIASEILNPDGILLRSQNMHDMEIPASVKGIARAGAGTNNIPIDKCSDRGIVVFNTPGANANAVKELVIAALFLSARKVVRGISWSQSLKGKGADVAGLVEKGKGDFGGTEIKGKKLGVIGLGAIGVMVANDALALGMDVVGYDPYISVEAAWGLSRNVRKAVSLEGMLAEVDYLTIHVPLIDATKNMINKSRLSIMKDGVNILNFSRAALVNNADIIEALASGKVNRYVTDFPEDEVLGIENVIPIPHLGASTEESEDNCAVMAVQELSDYLENGNITNSVNFPSCCLPFSSNTRLVIANKNIPNMVGQITTILAEAGINILDMLNKHNGNIAYNIINVENPVSTDVLDRIKKIDGVIMVRMITK